MILWNLNWVLRDMYPTSNLTCNVSCLRSNFEQWDYLTSWHRISSTSWHIDGLQMLLTTFFLVLLVSSPRSLNFSSRKSKSGQHNRHVLSNCLQGKIQLHLDDWFHVWVCSQSSWENPQPLYYDITRCSERIPLTGMGHLGDALAYVTKKAFTHRQNKLKSHTI